MASLQALPLELLELVIHHLLADLGKRQRQRQLEILALLMKQTRRSAQSRLFQHMSVVGTAQARRLIETLQTDHEDASGWLACQVKSLSLEADLPGWIVVASEKGPRYDEQLESLRLVSSLAPICKRLDTLRLFGPGLSLPKHVLGSLARTIRTLDLTEIVLYSNVQLPALQHLSLKNVSIRQDDLPLNIFLPSLESLSIHYSVTYPYCHLVRLSDLAATGPHLSRLNLGILSTFLSDLFDSPTAHSSLAPFTALRSLTLLANSASYRVSDPEQGGFFRLLGTLSIDPKAIGLQEFNVRTELGYRDKSQEVEGMCLELMRRLEEEEGSQLDRLETLRLGRVFESCDLVDTVRPLLELAKRRRVRVEFWDETGDIMGTRS